MADWSTRYLAALDARDRRESTHKSYIDAFTRLADRKSVAVTSNISGTASGLSDQHGSDEVNRLRQDLTTTQAARSSLQTQLQTLQASTTSLTTANATLTQQLTATHRQLAALERKLKDRDEELREKKKLVEDVQDETVALNMELNAMEREKQRLKGENAELVRRWMERMHVEVDKANREGGWE
ncbi:autophagy protein 16 [Aureobasidium pullulans]|uniref:Autophagy protein 16 n=1 Tax=Aureobasidium pullulans TaxID=5580 RepID=A0A4S8SU87_AURPU|nr:autophagy protein 16 [Aureobasidium pullulans]THZ12297.1 autophagy protein 16 [Aureobasidium pullulans]